MRYDIPNQILRHFQEELEWPAFHTTEVHYRLAKEWRYKCSYNVIY